jgi:hypothetical protein
MVVGATVDIFTRLTLPEEKYGCSAMTSNSYLFGVYVPPHPRGPFAWMS